MFGDITVTMLLRRTRDNWSARHYSALDSTTSETTWPGATDQAIIRQSKAKQSKRGF